LTGLMITIYPQSSPSLFLLLLWSSKMVVGLGTNQQEYTCAD
jgi:hypothetical protein